MRGEVLPEGETELRRIFPGEPAPEPEKPSVSGSHIQGAYSFRYYSAQLAEDEAFSIFHRNQRASAFEDEGLI